MLHPSASRLTQPISLESEVGDRADRSMDVLQYATAFLAIVVAALLAALR